MNLRNKSMIKILSLLFLAAMLIFVGQVNGEEEEYDEDTYGPADPVVWTKPVKAVIFTHKIHTMGAGLSCEDCHDDIFEMEAGAAESKDDFTMAALYDGKYCGACHDGDTAFASNTRCTACHIGVKGYNRLNGTEASGGHH